MVEGFEEIVSTHTAGAAFEQFNNMAGWVWKPSKILGGFMDRRWESTIREVSSAIYHIGTAKPINTEHGKSQRFRLGVGI